MLEGARSTLSNSVETGVSTGATAFLSGRLGELALKAAAALDAGRPVTVGLSADTARQASLRIESDGPLGSSQPASIGFSSDDADNLAAFGLSAWVSDKPSVFFAEPQTVRVRVQPETALKAVVLLVNGIKAALHGDDWAALHSFEQLRHLIVAAPDADGYVAFWLGETHLRIAHNSGSERHFEQAARWLETAHKSLPLKSGTQIMKCRLLRALARLSFQRPTAKPFVGCSLALDYLAEAESVLDRSRYPIEFAHLLYDRASVRLYMPKGKCNKRLELARSDVEAAMVYFDKQHFPFEYAQCCNALGRILVDTSKADDAVLQQTRGLYDAALAVRSKTRYPWHYAQTKHNLGGVLSLLADRGESALRAEAIASYEDALEIFDRQRYPQRHYQTLAALGRAYAAHAKDDRDAARAAMQCYDAVLIGISSRSAPYLYARTLSDSAVLAFQEGALDAGSALQRQRQALEIFTRQDFPFDRAVALISMAPLLLASGSSNPVSDAEQCYCEALNCLNSVEFPYEVACIHACLGSLALSVPGVVDRDDVRRSAKAHYDEALTTFRSGGYQNETALVECYLATMDYRSLGEVE